MIILQDYKVLFPFAKLACLEYLNTAMQKHGITTLDRRAAFLALVSVHTERLTRFEESALPLNPRTILLASATLSETLNDETVKEPRTALAVAAHLWETAQGNTLADAGMFTALAQTLLNPIQIPSAAHERERIVSHLKRSATLR